MLKRICAILLLGALSLQITAFASEGQIVSEEENNTSEVAAEAVLAETLTFTLEQAKEYAVANNPQIGVAESRIQTMKTNYDEMYLMWYRANKGAEAESLEGIPGEPSPAALISEGYYKDAAEYGLKLAEMGMEQTIEGIKIKVESDYFGLKNAIERQEATNDVLLYAMENLEIGELRYSMGAASDFELMGMQIVLQKAQNDHNASKRNTEHARKTLNLTLGLPIDTTLVLTDDVDITPPELEDTLENLAKAALETRLDVTAAKYDLMDKTRKFEITAMYYSSNTFTYRKAKYDAESSQISYDYKKEAALLSVYKAYDDMIVIYDTVGLAESLSQQAERNFFIAVIMYDNGMIANSEVTDALNKLTEAKLNAVQTKLAYNLVKQNFKNSYGIGI